MAAGELVTHRNVSKLCHLDVDLLQNTRVEFVALFAREDLDRDDSSALASFHALRSILDVACLLTEERPQEALFRSKLALALGSNLSYENVSGPDFCADADNAVFGQVLELG